MLLDGPIAPRQAKSLCHKITLSYQGALHDALAGRRRVIGGQSPMALRFFFLGQFPGSGLGAM